MRDEMWLTILQGIGLVVLAPGMMGLLHYFKAQLQRRRRRGRNVGQPYRDLGKLLWKTAVIPATASWWFVVTPMLLFVIYGLLAFTIPIIWESTLIPADLIMVIYLLGLARFVLALAGLDTGAPFGGLGGSREMFFHFITEICLFFLLAALALQWDTVNLRVLFTRHMENWGNIAIQPQFLLLGLSFFIIILFQNGRIPIDNPDTHLELTMGQRAITLEFSGPDLALIEWAEMIKFGFLLTLFIHLFLPMPLITLFVEPANFVAYQIGLILDYLIKLLIIIFVLAIWEVHRPKLRLRQVVRPGLIAIVLSVMAILYIVATVLFEMKGTS